MAKRNRYPGIAEAERERVRAAERAFEKSREKEPPDWLGHAPNYDKYPGVPPEQVLVWYNID